LKEGKAPEKVFDYMKRGKLPLRVTKCLKWSLKEEKKSFD